VVSVGGYLNSELARRSSRRSARGSKAAARILLNFQGTRLVNSIGISFVIGSSRR